MEYPPREAADWCAHWRDHSTWEDGIVILSRPIGIDLGTTNSAVAILDPNERDLIVGRDAQGRTTTPSCVWWDPKGDRPVVGHPAYARKGTRPSPVSSVKRGMGTRIAVHLGSRDCTPAEVSAHILRDLKRQMEEELARRSAAGVRYDVGKAIITVPAYFDLPAIEATREAGQLAGLEVVELLHEPTAAAIYSSWRHGFGDGVYLVYDLGGGTFDVSVLRRSGGEFLVLGIHGDNFLGGDDFDRRLAEYLRGLLVADGFAMNLDVTGDPEDQLRFSQLTALAEQIKINLTGQTEYLLRSQGVLRDKEGTSVVIETTVTRPTFEGLIGDLLDRTIECCHTAISKAKDKGGVTLADVDHILLVGGSTYVPAVGERLRQALCGEGKAARAVVHRDEPEMAVALGAALRAGTGLGVGDDDRRLRLWFRGQGATHRERTVIAGHAEPLAPGLVLEGGAVRLSDVAGEVLGEAPLGAGLRFTFSGLELQLGAVNEFRFEVIDATGHTVATLGRTIVQETVRRETVGHALSTAVLSKPILLDATDGDRLIRQILLPDGTSLPARARFSFAVTDPSGLVRLPIYQDNRMIKELRADVGAVAVGTPVEVEINCDELTRIRVRFSVAQQEFGGEIEPPPPDEVPTEQEVEEIDAQFAAVSKALDPADVARLREEYATVRKDLNEARSGGDYPKVIQRTADLRGLVNRARLVEPLRPAFDAVEKQYEGCLKLLPEAEGLQPRIARSSLRTDLASALSRAREAWGKRDRDSYQDAARLIQEGLQFLTAVIRTKAGESEQEDVAVQAMIALERVAQLSQFVLLFCMAQNRSDLLNSVRTQVKEVAALEHRVATQPVEVLQRCQMMMNQLQRWYRDLQPEDTGDTDLAGLVRVSGRPNDRRFNISE